MMMEEVKAEKSLYFIDGLEEIRLVQAEREKLSLSPARRKSSPSFGFKTTKPAVKESTAIVDVYAELVKAEVIKTKENT
ncbi:TPA: hypothetical protein ACTYZB_004893 [Klebsiella variicola]